MNHLFLLPQPCCFDPSNIISFNPFSHVVQTVSVMEIKEYSLDVFPSITITKAPLRMSKFSESSREG